MLPTLKKEKGSHPSLPKQPSGMLSVDGLSIFLWLFVSLAMNSSGIMPGWLDAIGIGGSIGTLVGQHRFNVGIGALLGFIVDNEQRGAQANQGLQIHVQLKLGGCVLTPLPFLQELSQAGFFVQGFGKAFSHDEGVVFLIAILKLKDKGDLLLWTQAVIKIPTSTTSAKTEECRRFTGTFKTIKHC